MRAAAAFPAVVIRDLISILPLARTPIVIPVQIVHIPPRDLHAAQIARLRIEGHEIRTVVQVVRTIAARARRRGQHDRRRRTHRGRSRSWGRRWLRRSCRRWNGSCRWIAGRRRLFRIRRDRRIGGDRRSRRDLRRCRRRSWRRRRPRRSRRCDRRRRPRRVRRQHPGPTHAAIDRRPHHRHAAAQQQRRQDDRNSDSAAANGEGDPPAHQDAP